jgi:hypothetical protein
MADTIFKGFYQALEAGLLTGSPDVRVKLVMGSFTGEAEEDAVHVSDLTNVDEFDGLGYGELDCSGVTAGYVDADDEWRLGFDAADFGDPVAPGSDVIKGLLAILHVDGDPAHDYVLGFTDAGGFGVNANNGPLSLALPAAGLLFVRQAA